MIKHLRLLLVGGALAVAMLAVAGAASALTPQETLKQPPFPPTDISLLSADLYTDGPPEVPAAQNPSGESAMRKQLKAVLVKRFGSGNAQVSQGLSIFDAAPTKTIVPNPRLRAALVSLKGTVGEPAINGTLDGTYSTVRFGTVTNPNFNAQVQSFPDGTLQIVFNDKYQFEDFRLMASTLAHEALHRDTPDSNKEELINNSIDILVYGQILLENPGLATSGTGLARDQNTSLLGRLNSRDATGKLRLLTGNGNLFPGSGTDFPYFAAGFEPLGDSTPGNTVLKRMVRNVVGSGVTLPTTVNFDDATVNLLDTRQKVFTPAQLVRLAEILKLDTSAPAAQTARAAEQTAPDTKSG